MPRSFVLRTPTGNVLMQEATYSTEALFQEMLANSNEVLSGDQINPSAPRRWLLVSREMPVPDSEGTNRWSLDHLFLDQDGIPTLIEVKRSSDTRIRREWVGQMLDYAANAVVHWPIEIIQERLLAAGAATGRSADEVLAEFLGDEYDDATTLQDFWEKVHVNLRAGKIRMIFVADAIPAELQRIIEFLNKQMNPAEVLGVEVRLHTGGNGYELLIPSVIGQTAEAQAIKSSTTMPRQTWDETRYFEDMAERLGDQGVQTARSIANWLVDNGLDAQFGGQGKFYGSLVAILRDGNMEHRPFVIYGDGAVEIRFNRISGQQPFSNGEIMIELINHLNSISGTRWGAGNINSHPSFRIEILYDPEKLSQFLGVWAWYVSTIRQSRSHLNTVGEPLK